MSRSELRGRLPAVLALLLAACAVLLIIGVSIEHSSASDRHDARPAAADQYKHEGEGEGEGEHAGEGTEAHTEQAGSESSETVLGVSIESPGTVGAMTVVSVALAALVWRRPTRPVTAVLVAFAVGAGVLDVAEVGHQVTEDRMGLASLAALIAALRLLVLVGAVALWRNSIGTDRPGGQAHTADPGTSVAT